MIDNELHKVPAEDIAHWISEVETSFNLTFEPGELAGVRTFGDLSDHIINTFTLTPLNDCTTQQAFYTLRQVLTDVLQVERISPQTLVAEVLPRKHRIRNAQRVERALGFEVGLLQPPGYVIVGLMGLLIASFFGFKVSPAVGSVGVLSSLVGFWLAAKWGRELTVRTVGELARRMAREHYLLSRRDATTFNRNEIEPLLTDWLCRDLCLSKEKVTRESRFEWASAAKQ